MNKIVGYESAPFTASDPDWFKRACLVGDPSSSGISTVQVQQWIKTRLSQIGYTQIDTVFGGNFVSQMSDGPEPGRHDLQLPGLLADERMVEHQHLRPHERMEAPLRRRDHLRYRLVLERNGREPRDSSAPARRRLPKGGIGAIGTATTGTHTRFNNCIHYGIMYGLIYQDLFTMGAALTRGKYELYVNYQAVDPNRVTIWSYWNNLMGDPAGECWTGYPDAMTVDASPERGDRHERRRRHRQDGSERPHRRTRRSASGRAPRST